MTPNRDSYPFPQKEERLVSSAREQSSLFQTRVADTEKRIARSRTETETHLHLITDCTDANACNLDSRMQLEPSRELWRLSGNCKMAVRSDLSGYHSRIQQKNWRSTFAVSEKFKQSQTAVASPFN